MLIDIDMRPAKNSLQLLLLIATSTTAMASSMFKSVNVFGSPLKVAGTSPMTGFYRDGKCNSGPDDHGNHVVAGVVSNSFLEFSKSRGNDLTSILRPGCAWCLCASRWKEALLAHRDDPNAFPADVVPKVMLDATHEKALQSVPLDELKKWSVTGPGRAAGEL